MYAPKSPQNAAVASSIFTGLLMCLWFSRKSPVLEPNFEESDSDWESFGNALHDILAITQSEIESEAALQGILPHAPALRGCCGAPSELKWVFLDGASAGVSVGTPFRTRFLALDAQGRPARASDCGLLRVNVTFGEGHARLSSETPLLSWENNELRLDILDQVAETVSIEVQIQGPGLGGPLLYSSRVRFSAGAAVDYGLKILGPSLGSGSWPSFPPRSKHDSVPLAFNASGARLPTLVVLEVSLTARDRFGNQVPSSALLASNDSSTCDGLTLRSASRSLDILSPGARFAASAEGEAKALVRGLTPGAAELWVETSSGQPAGLPSQRQQQQLLQLEFADPPGASTAAEANPSWEAAVAPSAVAAGKNHSKGAKWSKLAAEVRDEFLHAWRGYKRYAWGKDELEPLSKHGKDTFGNIGMTILDSLTTLWIMGLRSEFEEGAAFVERDLDFDSADREISVFEVVIRALGGLLGAHALAGRPAFLDRATELAERLLPALNSSSGFPMPRWNIARGLGKSTYNSREEPTILAEAGSLQLEFRYLSALTGDARFAAAADKASNAIRATGASGILPVHLSPPDHLPPTVMQDRKQMGALADSYYEYLLKQWLQSPGEVHFKESFLAVVDDLLSSFVAPNPLAASSSGSATPHFKLIEKAPNGAPVWKMDHLSCFVPGMIALGLQSLPEEDVKAHLGNTTWRSVAEGLTLSCADMWTSTPTGLAPEYVYLDRRDPGAPGKVPSPGQHSFLRPETAESLFYLYRLTGNNKYRKLGKKMFRAIVAHSKVEAGFASVHDVTQIPTRKMDDMQSFVMAETFKYLYLLFSPAETLDLDRFVLNTEAHPLRRLVPF